MVRLFMGYIPTRVIYAAAKLELTHHIGDDGATAQDLAQILKVDPAALYRIMRVLADAQVLALLVAPQGGAEVGEGSGLLDRRLKLT